MQNSHSNSFHFRREERERVRNRGRTSLMIAERITALGGVANGTVRYVLLSGSGGVRGGSQADVTTWVTQHGTVVPASEWGGASGGQQLYDLRGGAQ